MSPLLLHFALWVSLCAYLQLLEPANSHLFLSTHSPLVFAPSNELLCSVFDTSSYAMTAWVFFRTLPLPAVPQEFLLLEVSSGVKAIQALANMDGSVTVKVLACGTHYSLQLTPLANTWIHIAVSVNPTSQALAHSIQWSGVTRTATDTTSLCFPAFMPGTSSITIGGSSPVAHNLEMVDVRFYGNSLTVADIVAIANRPVCPIDCYGMCTGPSLSSCNFVFYVGRVAVRALNEEINQFSFNGARSDAAYSVTGWHYFEADSVNWRTLFRLTSDVCTGNLFSCSTLLVVLAQNTTPHKLILTFGFVPIMLPFSLPV